MSPVLIWPYQVHRSRHCFIKKNHLTNLSKLPTPITWSWEFTIPIPHWILHFFHIEEGLLITFHITILAHRTEEEFNSFAVRIFFRRRSERSLPPHQIKESRIVLGYQWPNLYYQIEEDLIVHTPSGGSSVTGVRTSGTTTPVDLPSEEEEELHEIPLPSDPLPELPGLPSISDINRRTAELRQWIEAHNQSLRKQPLTPRQRLAALLTCIQSRINLDEVAFSEGNITYRQLWRIDQLSNPHLYTKVSLREDTAYEPPCYQDSQDEGEAEEEVEEEEDTPLPIPQPPGTQSEIPPLEHNSQGLSLERLRESLDEHCGTLIKTMFHLPTSLESDWFQAQKQKHEAEYLVPKTFPQKPHVPGLKTRQKTGLNSLMDIQTWGHRSSIFSFFWQYSTSRWTFIFFITLSWFNSFRLVK